MQFRRITVRTPRGETSGIAFGSDGPPDLVFLHATGFNALTYRALLAPLGADCRVVALDQRGHGLSCLPKDPARLDTLRVYARDLRAMLKVLCASGVPPVLAGHSLGGLVALTATAARPATAASLVLVEPVLQPMRFIHRFQPINRIPDRIALLPIALGAARRRARFASKAAALNAYRRRGAFATWQEAFLADYVEDGFVAADEGVRLSCTPQWEAASFAALRHDGAALVGRVRRPTLIIRAERETTVREDERRLRRLNPDLKIEQVAGTTHFLPMERPELVRDRLRAALEARAGRTTTIEREMAHAG
jgi:pimeloyl-ACP methyl ester carboxylesterase